MGFFFPMVKKVSLKKTKKTVKTNVVAERYKFNTRNQRDELISECMAILRKLPANRFVCEVKSIELWDRLLHIKTT